MLLRKAEEYKNQPPIFKNDNLTEAVQEIRLSVYNYDGIDTKEINIQFIDKKSAKAFCEELPEVCPVKYPASYPTIQNNVLPSIHPAYLKYSCHRQGPFEVRIILSEQIYKDLETTYTFLSQYMSEENLNVIKNYAQPRSLSCLEQEFYTKLNDLTSENLNQLFNILLKDAKKISEKERGIQINALWDLAMRCKEIEPLENKSKLVETLSAITEDDNYYKKAQKEFIELSYGWITTLKDSPNKQDLLSKIITSTTLFIKKEPHLINLLKQAILSYSGKYDLMDNARQQASEAIDKTFEILMENRKGDVGNLITKLIDLYEAESDKFKLANQKNISTQTEEDQFVFFQPQKQASLMFSQPGFTDPASVSSSSTDEPSPKKTKFESLNIK